MNAIGTRSSRVGGGRAGKTEWQGDWEAAVKRVPDGWTCEMRIPWGILNFARGKGPANFGINFNRFQERTKIESEWSNTGTQRFLDLMGTWDGVQPPAAAFKPSLSVLPYILPNVVRNDFGFRAGLDARYTLTPELTAVGSINPDFGTIEGAVEGIQFSRSERFVPERRPFFLEGEDYIQFGEPFEIGVFFYPRRIETFDTGVKVYGKLTAVDTIGILNVTDYGCRNDMVLNYRRDLSATSRAGFFFTQKSAIDENNTIAAFNQSTRWGKFSLTNQFAYSGGTGAGDVAKQISFAWDDKNRFYWMELLDVPSNFRIADGLLFFTGHRGFHFFSDGGAQWRKGFWRGYNLTMYPQWDWHWDGRPFRRGFGFNASLDTRTDWQLGLQGNYQKFDNQLDATIGGSITRGISNRFLQIGIEGIVGKQADRPYSFIGPRGSVRLFKKLDIAYGGAVQYYDGRQQQHVLTLNYELSPTRSFGGRVVTQDADTNWYLSYRNSGKKGTEMFFILGDPNARRFSRQAAVKVVFAL